MPARATSAVASSRPTSSSPARPTVKITSERLDDVWYLHTAWSDGKPILRDASREAEPRVVSAGVKEYEKILAAHAPA